MTNIVLCGEAWGADEAREGRGFVGWQSRFLNGMLDDAGLSRSEMFLTNVFNIRYDGKTEIFCGPKSSAIPGWGSLKKGYVQLEFLPELERLRDEIITISPNLILAMGNAALWAFSGHTGIAKHRGCTFLSTHLVPGIKVLPTYHPAAVAHQYTLRSTVVLDLMKAAREAEYPELRRVSREIWIEPALEDLESFYDQHIRGCQILSVDIETAGNQITCIGFAPSNDRAIVVPIYDFRRKGRSYWQTADHEQQAWAIVRRILEDPHIGKLFQNGLYDISFLWRAYGIKVMGAEHDTLLLHHALMPESLKSLGFLGSIYCDEGAWKQMRDTSTIKRDE